eukprot:scaffold43448_cov51-Cyclotella_meneghiniana.AAC.9
MSRSSTSVPPLPQGLSERMLNTIDQRTGCCINHPKVRMCEYVEEKQRWVFRRKTCHQCGARSSVGGAHHRPGRAVRNPSSRRISQDFDASDRSGRSGRSGRSSMYSSSSSYDS